LESASLLEAQAGESTATETDARLGAIARLALAAAGVSDPAGCAEDPGEFPGQFSQPRLRLPGLPGLCYCERIAAQAVSISPGYLTEVLKKYAEMDETMATGRLWVFDSNLTTLASSVTPTSDYVSTRPRTASHRSFHINNGSSEKLASLRTGMATAYINRIAN